MQYAIYVERYESGLLKKGWAKKGSLGLTQNVEHMKFVDINGLNTAVSEVVKHEFSELKEIKVQKVEINVG